MTLNICSSVDVDPGCIQSGSGHLFDEWEFSYDFKTCGSSLDDDVPAGWLDGLLEGAPVLCETASEAGTSAECLDESASASSTSAATAMSLLPPINFNLTPINFNTQLF